MLSVYDDCENKVGTPYQQMTPDQHQVYVDCVDREQADRKAKTNLSENLQILSTLLMWVILVVIFVIFQKHIREGVPDYKPAAANIYLKSFLSAAVVSILVHQGLIYAGAIDDVGTFTLSLGSVF